MSRAAAQTTDTTTVSIDVNLDDLTCPLTGSIFFKPIIIVSQNPDDCGHCFEEQAIARWKQQKLDEHAHPTCPTCRKEIVLFAPALHIKSNLEKALSQHPELYADVYFNLDHFAEIVQKNEFRTPVGERFISLLENAKNHLNQKPITLSNGESAIEILASTRAGRDLLRKNASIRALISPESLQIQIKGTRIQDWLAIGIEVERDEEYERGRIDIEIQVALFRLDREFSQGLRFLSRRAQNGAAASMDQRPSHPAVNEILQNVVHGNKEAVRTALENLRTENPDLFRTVLIATATQPIIDYSGRSIVDQTLFKAAVCASDGAINPDDEGMCEMIASYLPADEVATQLAELFPGGIEAHEIEQQRNAFNFDAIFVAIRAANTRDLDAALNKTNNGSPLCLALDEFRRQFSELSHNEKIFNPQHLLRAFEVYNAFCDQCERDGSDHDYKKRDLFWRQIIGYTQRFMPACYAQVFAQGLFYLVNIDQDASWRPEPFNRALEFKNDNFPYYFPLPVDPRSGLGFTFAICASVGMRTVRCAVSVWEHDESVFSKTLVEQKQQAFRTYYAALSSHAPVCHSVMR